jgi:hypothetical protein
MERFARQARYSPGWFPNLTLQSLTPSEEVDSIHANECVILRCHQCRALAHLSCVEEWFEKRHTGYGTSCCVW